MGIISGHATFGHYLSLAMKTIVEMIRHQGDPNHYGLIMIAKSLKKLNGRVGF